MHALARSSPLLAALVLSLLGVPGGASTNATPALDVLTLNLRSRQDQPDLREPAVAAYLRQARPDVVLLQEVGNVRGPELTQAHRLARTADYELATCFDRKTNRGLAVLSRHAIVDVVVERLPRRERPVLGVVLNVGGRLVSFVDVHLTPQLAAGKQRKRELAAALKLMRALPAPAFIGGDFNFGDMAGENALLSELLDTYRTFEPDAPGHTWDLQNPLAKKNSYPTEPSRRLDRILSGDKRARVTDAKIVLDDPVTGGIFPSDHYGVFVRVVLPPTVPPAPAPTAAPTAPTR